MGEFTFEPCSEDDEIELNHHHQRDPLHSPVPDLSSAAISSANDHQTKNIPCAAATHLHQLEEEDYNPEGDNNNNNGVKKKSSSFFAPMDIAVSLKASSFRELRLSPPLLRACQLLRYMNPTPIQAACIPKALDGFDICGSALTGSGKTAAYALPTLERLLHSSTNRPAIRVLILTPTRELAAQVHIMIRKLGQFLPDIRCCLVTGGQSRKAEEADLRSLPDIVVATPGRMMDHLLNSVSVHLDELAVLILDEADKLLEHGFNAQIHELVKFCPKRRQTMLFSATMTEEVGELVKLSLKNPVRLLVDPMANRPATLREEFVRIRRIHEGNDEAILLALCSKTYSSKVIIFSGTKIKAHRLKILFGLVGLKAAELHTGLTHSQRQTALELFKEQSVDFLIGTDILSRGLDIIDVQTVINFECSRDFTSYVHRVGRTARAGREGCAVTFVTDDDRSLIKEIAEQAAGSRWTMRTVHEQSIKKWSQIIEQMEHQVSLILQQERAEMALRKAEMEATKVENMIAHHGEIYSRPKRIWFITEKEKQRIAESSKGALVNKKGSRNQIVSAEKAEDFEMKEKRQREREKNLPRKKRLKLEATRAMLLEDQEYTKGEEETKKEHGRFSLVACSRRAKEVKGAVTRGSVVKKPIQESNSRELFRDDMSQNRRRMKTRMGGKNSFKSKSRFRRR